MPQVADRPNGCATVHVFPGQGDFTLSPVIRALAVPVLREALERTFRDADAAGARFGLRPIGPRLLGPAPPSTVALTAEAPGTLQLALFGVSLAVHRALEAGGLVADRLVAVSFGEIPALVAADALATMDGALLACRLGQLLCRPGGLTLLRCGEWRARSLLAHSVSDTVIACVNDSDETVLSGPKGELAQVELAARRAGVDSQRLRLPFLAHHPALRTEAEQFEAFARSLPMSSARLPVHSAVAGSAYPPDADLPAALGACLIRPAVLPTVLRQAVTDSSTVLEAGTGSALTRSIRRTVPTVRAHAPLAEPDFPWEPGAGRLRAGLRTRIPHEESM
ncbi:acyltransferase domain-containing protein [Kitasatospora kifunensis]|uniref:Acyl transferase domain-containing protein n=1 Tax=Kitasatospora kifunensis TaxID=58351 RepID=A0A7W7R733_KITKI|nr:acyltransferase domain-containing protein [Kitasatospora kifunensis]MBB4926635.1 acyl transferase domain-containing protein [Kitasatospora kifunensis]